MKKLYLLSIFVSSLCFVQAQSVIFVKAGSNGNGTSWDRPLGDLQTALRAAHSGTEIWVAAGTYYPTAGADRSASFIIPDGVRLFGGFAGYEGSVAERNLAANRSILSGEIGQPGQEDNAFSVVFTRNVSENTVVDGFIITGGAANSPAEPGNPRRCGGGWFNLAVNSSSNPTIVNCYFYGNYGHDGGAFYNLARNGEANPRILSSSFVANRAELDGGAIFNDAGQGKSNPVIDNCLFQENQASYGAGVMNQCANGEVRPTIRNSKFFGNVSLIRGSGVYNNRLENGICAPLVQNCLFEDNLASVGESQRPTFIASDKAASGAVSDKGYR